MVTTGNPRILLSVHVSPCLCVYFSAHTYQPLPGFFLTFQSFARSCPEAQRDLLASFACKVERALLWPWVASRQSLPCGLPDWASQQPSLFPTCWGGAWQHSAQHLKVLSISSLPHWGSTFCRAAGWQGQTRPIHKDPSDRQTKGMDKILKRLSWGCRVSNAGIAMLLALYKYPIKQKYGEPINK